MSVTPRIAVLSYHGWEIDPDHLSADVKALRAAGWRDLSLAGLEAALTGGREVPSSDRYFHVTIDDGAEQDLECVTALQALSCAVTLFAPLEAMTDRARDIYRKLATAPHVAIGDHSLRHNRTFHYRHIVGFHAQESPLMTSPDRLGLQLGDPVCTYGAELAAPAFTPDPSAQKVCRQAAFVSPDRPGSVEWSRSIAERLLKSGLGFRRLGRLCIAGGYESPRAFRQRLSAYLTEGRERLSAFLGCPPIAFAHPWCEPSVQADEELRALGYRLTFARRGLCHQRLPTAIPRLFVSNETPRPVDPVALAGTRESAAVRWAREVGRRAVFR
jgi:hypothetical protein